MDYIKYKKAKKYYWGKRATNLHINYAKGELLFVQFGINKPTNLNGPEFTDWCNDLTYEELSNYNNYVICGLKCNIF